MDRRPHVNESSSTDLPARSRWQGFGYAALVEVGSGDLDPGSGFSKDTQYGARQKSDLCLARRQGAEDDVELCGIGTETEQLPDGFPCGQRLRLRMTSAKKEQMFFAALVSPHAKANGVTQLEFPEQPQNLVEIGIPLVFEGFGAGTGVEAVDRFYRHSKHHVNGPAGLDQLHQGCGRNWFQQALSELISAHEVVSDGRAFRPAPENARGRPRI